jgi:hypothetical protein
MENTTVTMDAGSSVQAQSRVVFVDEMTDDHIADLTDSQIIANAEDRLQFVPFYEVNTTLLSEWYPRCLLSGSAPRKDCASPVSYEGGGYDVSPGTVTVLNQDIDNIEDPVNNYFGSYFRGILVAGATVSSASVLAWADMHDANSGFTGQPAIYPGYEAFVVPSSLPVTVDNSLTDIVFSGSISKATSVPNNLKLQQGDVTATVNGISINCEVIGSGQSPDAYNCTVAGGNVEGCDTALVSISITVPSGYGVTATESATGGSSYTRNRCVGDVGLNFTYTYSGP